jgi:KaiC/GvpD/RAD55 family RecA-like ATPase
VKKKQSDEHYLVGTPTQVPDETLSLAGKTTSSSQVSEPRSRTSQRFDLDIDVLRDLLPDGIPRNDLILLLGEAGTGKSFVMLELLYKILSVHREPCVFVNIDDPYLSVEQHAASLGWDLYEFEKSGLLKFLDCFSYRMGTRTVPAYVKVVPDPKDLRALTSFLLELLDEMQMVGRGAVFVDSVTEMFTLVSEAGPLLYQVLDTMKSWRARGPKERYVAFFCSHHFGIEQYRELEDLLFYAVDGIIDLRFDPDKRKDTLIHQIRVREMKGARNETEWLSFAMTDQGVKALEAESANRKRLGQPSSN